MTFESLLYAAGQLLSRSGSTYSYCVSGGRGLAVSFNDSGRVAKLIGRR
jgi:hypothetical protein